MPALAAEEIQVISVPFQLAYRIGRTARVECDQMMVVFLFAGFDSFCQSLEDRIHKRFRLDISAEDPDYVIVILVAVSKEATVFKSGLIGLKYHRSISVACIPQRKHSYVYSVLFRAFDAKVQPGPERILAFIVVIKPVPRLFQCISSVLVCPF